MSAKHSWSHSTWFRSLTAFFSSCLRLARRRFRISRFRGVLFHSFAYTTFPHMFVPSIIRVFVFLVSVSLGSDCIQFYVGTDTASRCGDVLALLALVTTMSGRTASRVSSCCDASFWAFFLLSVSGKSRVVTVQFYSSWVVRSCIQFVSEAEAMRGRFRLVMQYILEHVKYAPNSQLTQ